MKTVALIVLATVVFVLAFVLVYPSETVAAPQAKVTTEWVGRTSRTAIYRFRDGSNVCYIADRDFDNTAITCTKAEP